MSEFKASGFRDEFGSGGPDLVGITTMTSPYYFVPPSGSTAERPSGPPPGMLRFNTDIGRLEVWRNNHWATILGESPNLGGGTGSNTGTGTRGTFMGDAAPSNVIQFITVPTLGDAQDFGNLTRTNSVSNSGASSRTRGFAVGGGSPQTDTIDTFVFASTGDATDFGNLSDARRNGSAVSNQTRAVYGGGWKGSPSPTTYQETIDYFTMASTGDAVDFGDMIYSLEFIGESAAGSSVRGVWFGGSIGTPSPGTKINTIQYVTLSTTGDAQDFGDISVANRNIGCANSSTRIVAGGGQEGPVAVTRMQFTTTATLGNSQDFGDLTTARRCHGALSSPTRGIFAGGYGNSPTPTLNSIDFITIPTTGNAQDFGDLLSQYDRMGSCSNGHGGL